MWNGLDHSKPGSAVFHLAPAPIQVGGRNGQKNEPNRRLRRQRTLHHWTLERVATELDRLCTEQERKLRRGYINAKMVSQWECGNHIPDVFWREKLCQLYGIDAEALGFVEPLLHEGSSSMRISSGSSAQELPVIMTLDGQTQAMRLLERAEAEPVEAQAGAWLTLGIDRLAHLFDEGWSVEEIVIALQTVLQGVQAMSKFNRRYLFQLGVAAVMSGIVLPTGSHVTAEERAQLGQALGTSIAAGWQLFHRASNAQVLAVGQAQLYQVQQASQHLYPTVCPLLYSSAYNLIGAAYHFQGRYQDAHKAHEQAYTAALEAMDVLNMAQSRVWQANGLREQQHYLEAFQTIEAALRLVSQQRGTDTLWLQAHLFASGAEMAALLGKDKVMWEYLDTSQTMLSQLPYEYHDEFDHVSWHQYSGTCALILNQNDKAAEELQTAMDRLPPESLIRQIITLMPLAIAYARTKDRERCLETLKRAAVVANTIHSPTLNKQFANYIQQEMLGSFTSDRDFQTFASDIERQVLTGAASTLPAGF